MIQGSGTPRQIDVVHADDLSLLLFVQVVPDGLSAVVADGFNVKVRVNVAARVGGMYPQHGPLAIQQASAGVVVAAEPPAGIALAVAGGGASGSAGGSVSSHVILSRGRRRFVSRQSDFLLTHLS
jgi:hypothetical protein